MNFGSIIVMVTESGQITLSVDGLGTTAASGSVSVEKLSAGATVRGAYLAAATILPFPPATAVQLADGDITINGSPVSWDATTGSGIGAWNHWADVTSIVAPIVDPLGSGVHSLTIGEADSANTDGTILAVIFDDASADPKTVQLFFGAQELNGDSFTIALPAPVDLADPNLAIDMGLGISFGFQSGAFPYQVNEVDVNGTRVSSSAGGQDDGEDLAGALLTVGGLGDSNGNPADPNALPSSPSFPDDELYDLIPFVSQGDTSILVETRQGPPDPEFDLDPFDNIFFASVCTSIVEAVEPPPVTESIVLAPATDTNTVGDTHTVTATITDSNGDAVVGRQVDFEVTAGPHIGVNGSSNTDASGEATFSYVGTDPGIDTIVASFVDNQQQTQQSNPVTKTWEEAEPPPPQDTTRPTCTIVAINSGPPLNIDVAFQDTGSGLASITVMTATNATVDIDPFTPGTTDPVMVNAAKIINNVNAFVLLEIADMAGNTILCDPVMLKLESRPGAPVNETVTDVPEAEGWVLINNGTPGLPSLHITVNGLPFHVDGLADGEERVLNVFAAMRPGNDNTFVFRSPDVEGNAVVLISDIPPASVLPGERFRRGDVNADGRVDISDPVLTLNALFLGEEPPRCEDAADANDDGTIDLADPIFTVSYLFGGGDEPSAPFRSCDVDPTADSLDCAASQCR